MIVTARIAAGREALDSNAGLILPWWSVSKTVLAAATFRLAEQGRLDLDSPIADRPFTVRQLLAHRAGLADYGGLADYHAAVARGDAAWPPAQLLSKAGADRLLFAPGQGWAYSNIGYLLVRQEIERLTDAPLADALHKLVFAPLGLNAFVVNGPADMRRLAWPGLHGYDPGWVYHGLVVGTAADAAHFMDRLFTTSFLTPPSLIAMQDSVPLPYAAGDRPFRSPRPGTGLMIDPDGPLGLWLGHSGGGPGSVCAVYHFPARRVTVAAFADHDDSGAIERTVLENVEP